MNVTLFLINKNKNLLKMKIDLFKYRIYKINLLLHKLLNNPKLLKKLIAFCYKYDKNCFFQN